MKNLYSLVFGLIFSICSISTNLIAQNNLDFVSSLNINQMHNTELNDIWGYADGVGNEYALVGTRDGTSIVNVTVPQSPTEVFFGPGMNSVWRDIKTWNNYAYVTTEAQQGLYIIDLTNLPNNNLATTLYTGPIGNSWFSAHNLYIDDNGFAYIFGANRDNGGVIILDLNTDPMNPTEVGTFDNWYVHDGYVLGNKLFSAHIGEGFFSVVDITDKSSPVLLGTKNTPNDFSHNIWARADAQVVFTTDEVSGAFIASYDVSDPSNIFELDRVQSSPGAGVIPHNTHVLGNFLITSYYSDGVTLHDATYPYNLIEIGSYDTYPFQTTSYDGSWGAYPFLPSGLVLASDITEGLFVLNPTYQQAAYLEGTITDAVTVIPLQNVTVTLSGQTLTEQSNSSGFYASGLATAQAANVTYSKGGYYPQTVNVNLINGVVTTQNIVLVPIPPFNLNLHVQDMLGSPINNAQIKLVHPLITHTGSTNALGDETFSLYYQDNYYVEIGKWGFFTSCQNMNIDQTTNTITITLQDGIFDDFEFDFGWTTTTTASSGAWERAIPFNGNTASPLEDVMFDCGNYAFVTGNSPTLNADLDDVDGGFTQITSPIFDLTTYTTPYVNFSYWLYNNYGPLPPADDTLIFTLNNGITTAEILKVGSLGDTAFWQQASIEVSAFITPTANMTLTVYISDFDPAVNITEAGFDYFFIGENLSLGINKEISVAKSIYPNPTNSTLNISGFGKDVAYQIYNTEGKLMLLGKVENQESINVEILQKGFYLIKIEGEVFRFLKD